MILISVALLSISSAVFSQDDYMGIYYDSAHSVCEYYGLSQFTVWIWHYPGNTGMLAAEFSMSYPPDLFYNGKVPNPDLTMEVDDVTTVTGGSIEFAHCANDWKFSYMVSFTSTSTTPGYIQILPHPVTGQVLHTDCINPTYETHEVTVLNHFGINQPCAIGTNNASWGAVKSLFKK